MPFSNLEQITPILSEVRTLRPKSILDVGCGLGVYGYLCRIYLELYGDDANFLKKLKRQNPWEVRIDAIEGFKDYLEFIPKWAYDDIMIGPAMNALSKIPRKEYDLVLALAILEHFSREDGMRFLYELRRIGGKIILSVPKQWNAQVVPENEFETHRSHWTDAELLSWGFNRILPHPYAWIAVFDGEDQKRQDEEIPLFSKRPQFHNNPYRFLFKLFPIISNDTKTADIVQNIHDNSLRSFSRRHETTAYERWALRRRLGSTILSMAVVEVRGETLFVRDLASNRTYLKQMLMKLENLAFERGLKSIAIGAGIDERVVGVLGYAPVV